MTDVDVASLMRSVLGRVATGPELGRSISREEARDAMQAVLDGRVHEVQAAVFLIALRMKRETDDENLGLLDAMLASRRSRRVAVERLVDIADPYDGFDRCLPASPFLPALLAACGLPAFCHGVLTVGPKHGVTSRQVLEAAGADCSLSTGQAAGCLQDPGCGWAYLDQERFAPSLHALLPLRELIVKRPAITTLEKLLHPLRADGETLLLTGYVHKAYPRVYSLMARRAGFDSALIVRGVEGGVVPSLRQPASVYGWAAGGEDDSFEISPAETGIACELRAPQAPDGLADDDRAGRLTATLQAGLDALRGAPGATRDALVHAGAFCLWRCGSSESTAAAAAHVRDALDSGAALARFEAFKKARRGSIP